MQGQRYPITETRTILNLSKRLIDVAEQDRQHEECEVKLVKDAKSTGEALHAHRGGPSHEAALFSLL